MTDIFIGLTTFVACLFRDQKKCFLNGQDLFF